MNEVVKRWLNAAEQSVAGGARALKQGKVAMLSMISFVGSIQPVFGQAVVLEEIKTVTTNITRKLVVTNMPPRDVTPPRITQASAKFFFTEVVTNSAFAGGPPIDLTNAIGQVIGRRIYQVSRVWTNTYEIVVVSGTNWMIPVSQVPGPVGSLENYDLPTILPAPPPMEARQQR